MPDPIFSLAYQDAEVQQLLTGLQERSSNTETAMRDIGEEALLQFDEGFEREEDPYGIAWAPVSARTLAFKESNTRILKTLQSTGRGRASLTYVTTRDSVTVGTNVKYMRKHQLGQGVTQRQFLGIGPRLRMEIILILQDYVVQGDD